MQIKNFWNCWRSCLVLFACTLDNPSDVGYLHATLLKFPFTMTFLNVICFNDIDDYTNKHILFKRREREREKKKNARFGGWGACFISGINRCMALCFNKISNPMQHTTPRSISPTSSNSPLPSTFPAQFKANRTHLGQVGQTCSRQSERPCKRAWIVPGTPEGVGGHPSASDLQPDLVHV